ncbi:MAG: HGGxSTG domain-containing protein [Methyloceanibacter sp.]
MISTRSAPGCGPRSDARTGLDAAPGPRRAPPVWVRVEPGKRRCRFHGGLSTGPRTAEGRARIAAVADQACPNFKQVRRWLTASEHQSSCSGSAADQSSSTATKCRTALVHYWADSPPATAR